MGRPEGHGAASGQLASRRVSLVFSDLDDSFLTRDKRVTERNLAALDALAARGGAFVPCTGRTVGGVPEPLRAHPSTRFLVGSNGAEVVDAATGAAIHRSLMDVALVTRVYEAVADLDISFDCFVGTHVFCERRRYEAIGRFGLSEHNLRTVRSIRTPYDEEIPALIAGADGVGKVTLYWPDDDVATELARRLATFSEIDATSSAAHNFEIMAHGTSKGSALAWLAGHLGVPRDEVVAFGDAGNDAEMLAAAGIGVAVANATDAAKAAADVICGDCDESGVGECLLALLGEGA